MAIMDYVKKVGGAATGKVIKMALDYVPFDFPVGAMSLKNILGSIAVFALADRFTYGDVRELLETGSAVMMADEIEKQARGLTAPAPAAVPRAVPRAVPKTTREIIMA